MNQEAKDIDQLAEHLFRENSGKMVSVLSHIFGLRNLERVMDVVQDTFETALLRWRYKGMPENPSGWLMQVAKNKTINALKRDNKFTIFDPSVFATDFDNVIETGLERFFLPHEIEDSQLRLLLICCHPDFSEKNQIILTLHILCGFSNIEIANALLMTSEAVKKALARSKSQLKEKGNILQTPLLLQYEKRIHTVHTILYLMFNEGYKTTRSKEIINHDLCYESMRLTKLLLREGVALNNESRALLSLMFFNIARFPSRISSADEIVTLADQDRKKWNMVFIKEGYFYLNQATEGQVMSRFHLEAIIASVHCTSTSFEKTDWKTIVYLYKQLEHISPSPLTTLNKIMAISYLYTADDALCELERMKQDSGMEKHYLLHSAEGNLLRRSGKIPLARRAFAKALDFAQSPLEKQFLEKQILNCTDHH